MNILSKTTLFVCLFLVGNMLVGCGDNSTVQNTEVYKSLPPPTTSTGTEFKDSGSISLTASALNSGTIGTTGVSEYNSYAERDNQSGWAFGLDRTALKEKLGENDVIRYETGVKTFLKNIFTHQSVLNKLDEAVNSYPMFKNHQDITSLTSLDNVQISALSVADGIVMPDSSTKSAITLKVLLPFVLPVDNSRNLSSCSNVVSELYASNTDGSFIAPADATWSYVISVTLVFFIDDRSALHTNALSTLDQDTVTSAETAAVADDFGLMVWFLNNINTANIPSFDAIFTFKASDALMASTLGPINGQAKTDDDTSCLMNVDAMTPEASLMIPNITGVNYLNGDYEYYIHKYSEDLDLLTAGAEYGASCLYDKDGNIVTVDGNSSCATATGTYDIVSKGKSKDGKAIYGVITPYQKIAGVTGDTTDSEDITDGLAAYNAKTTSGICNSSPWSHLRTGRFGRGIRLAVSEWAVHGQVADYWNIHWYQRADSAAEQSLISDAAYLFKLVAQTALNDGSWWGYAFASAGLAYKYASKFDISIAGHRMGGKTNSGIGDFIVAIIRYGTLTTSVKGYLQSIGISETVDGMAQIIQTQVTGWQDYYSGSHKVCGFKFK